MSRRSTPRHRRLADDAVTVRIHRVRMRRVKPGRSGWLLSSMYSLVLLVGLAVMTLPVAYAFFGTEIPFMVNDAGTGAPPSLGDRLKGAAIGSLCWIVVVAVLWRPVGDVIAFRGPHRFGSRRIGFDAAGVWLARGRRVVAGLEWPQVAAVSIVEEWREAGAPTRPPYVELFPVAAAEPTTSLLGALIVEAAPPRPGLRGKRYLVRLDCDAVEVGRMVHGLDRFAPGKRVAGRG